MEETAALATRRPVWVLVAAVFVASCSRRPAPPTAGQQPSGAPQVARSVAVPTAASAPLPFIEDDYERARSEATRRNVPLFVDVWASWCHTCSSIRQYVLHDPTLAPLADSYVWLAIDFEKQGNGPFLRRFESRSLPTLWVIEAASETPILKWIGAATASELHDVLAETAKDGSDAPQPAAAADAEANAEWRRGMRASAAGDAAQAAEHLRGALAVAPSGWARRARTVEALSMRLVETHRNAEVVALAAREAAAMPRSTAQLNVVLNAIDAAAELAAGAPERKALPELIRLGITIADRSRDAVLLDDRSSLYMALVNTLKASDPATSRALAVRWSRLLDAQAAGETDPAKRRVWDPHRVEAYLALGDPARAIPLLEQSEREQPNDFNPPARLARVYLSLGRVPEAHAAIDRAIGLSEGPRKLRLYMLKSEVLVAAHDTPGAKTALEEALRFAEQSRLPPQFDELRRAIERRVRELS